MNAPILAAINLVCVLLCAGLLAYACTKAHWTRSFGLVAVAVVLWNVAWLIPQAVSAFGFDSPRPLVRLWFANWLVSAFAAVLLSRMMARLPREFADVARMDGLGAMGTFSHMIFPYAKSILVVVAIFTAMGTWMEFLRPLLAGSVSDQVLSVGAELNVQSPVGLATAGAASVLLALPVIALAYFIGRPSLAAAQLTHAQS
jgi:multiple sugar transport system permease protein